MLSKQEGLSLGFACVAAIVLYYILAQVYSYLIGLVVLYIGYRFIQVQVEETIEVVGKSVLITGCDTGFGHDLALRLESLGCTVYAGCLQPKSEGPKKLNEKNTGLMHVLHLDVTNDESVSDAIQYVKKHSKETEDRCRNLTLFKNQVLNDLEQKEKDNTSPLKLKGLWAVVNNAGIRRVGDIELIPLEQMKRVAEVNLYGTVRDTKAFIPLIRKSKGRIVNVSSVRGRMALAEDVSYCCTKYALEAFSDILRREMAKFDVKVSVIEPGHFGAATAVCGKAMCDIIEKDLTDAWNCLPSDVQALYGWDYVNKLIQDARFSGTAGAPTTTACVDAMVDALRNTYPKTRYQVPGKGRFFDMSAVIPVLHNYLPDTVMDLFLAYLTPSQRLALEIKP